MNEALLHTAIKDVADRDVQVATALSSVGYPVARVRPPGFESLLRIIVGQQLSVRAADTIFARLKALTGPQVNAQTLLNVPPEDLRGAGLSKAKMRYAQAAAEAVETGDINFATLPQLAETDAVKQLTQVPGIGPWTAQIYLLFCDGRPDVWPAGDLALQEALRRLKGFDERPTAKASIDSVAPWAPYRGAMAIFLWHYYAASDAPV